MTFGRLGRGCRSVKVASYTTELLRQPRHGASRSYCVGLSILHPNSRKSLVRPKPPLTHEFGQLRHSSHSPIGASNEPLRKKVTLPMLGAMYRRNEPITMITAHDFPSAHAADTVGMDIVLVGDSLAMVALGMDDTSELTVEDMLLHCKSVSRGARSAFVVCCYRNGHSIPETDFSKIGDMPMGSYEVSPEQALTTAIRFVKEGRAQGVKLEGGAEMARTVSKITSAGIPVLAHVGLTPQRQNALGGFRVQGKNASSAMKLLKDARAVQEAGAFAVVVEAVPSEVATLVTKALRIPTISIGAGNGCSGQVLVQIDMSGNYPPGRHLPKFVKPFGDVWAESCKALRAYHEEVKARSYPATEHTYAIAEADLKEIEDLMEQATAISD